MKPGIPAADFAIDDTDHIGARVLRMMLEDILNGLRRQLQHRERAVRHHVAFGAHEERRRQGATRPHGARKRRAGRLELVHDARDRLRAEEHRRRVPRPRREIENRPLRHLAFGSERRDGVIRQGVLGAVRLPRDAPEVLPLRTQVVPLEFSLEPSDIGLGVFPRGQTPRTRQRAEERNEIGPGADVHDVEIARDGCGML